MCVRARVCSSVGSGVGQASSAPCVPTASHLAFSSFKSEQGRAWLGSSSERQGLCAHRSSYRRASEPSKRGNFRTKHRKPPLALPQMCKDGNAGAFDGGGGRCPEVPYLQSELGQGQSWGRGPEGRTPRVSASPPPGIPSPQWPGVSLLTDSLRASGFPPPCPSSFPDHVSGCRSGRTLPGEARVDGAALLPPDALPSPEGRKTSGGRDTRSPSLHCGSLSAKWASLWDSYSIAMALGGPQELRGPEEGLPLLPKLIVL